MSDSFDDVYCGEIFNSIYANSGGGTDSQDIKEKLKSNDSIKEREEQNCILI